MRAVLFAASLSAAAALAALPAVAGATDPAPQPAGDAAAGDRATTETGQGSETPLEFRKIVGGDPIEIAADKLTPAFEAFRATGENPFKGDDAALAGGKALYARLCQACHLPDGSGRIGPSLRDDAWRHPGLETPAGRFAIIHSGGAGAMQAFAPRMTLDEILEVMAWIDTFRES